MSIKIEIAIKISRQRAAALFAMYEWVIGGWESANNLDHLLLSHARIMHWRLDVLVHKKWSNTTILLVEP